jgi:hypothetical protein
MSETFPFMRESSVSTDDLPDKAREAALRTYGDTVMYLYGLYGDHAAHNIVRGWNDLSLNLHNRQDGTLVTIDGKMLARSQLGNADLTLASLSEAPGAAEAHHYTRFGGRTLTRVDLSAENLAQVGVSPPLAEGVVVIPEEAQDLHQYMLHTTDGGLYVSITTNQALALQGLHP